MSALSLAPGLLLLAAALIFALHRWWFVSTARRLTGTVVRNDFRVSRGRRGYGGRHHAVVRFDLDGATHEVTSKVGTTTPRFRVGTSVSVLCQDGPASAILDTTLDVHLHAIVLGIAGSLALVLGAWTTFGPR